MTVSVIYCSIQIKLMVWGLYIIWKLAYFVEYLRVYGPIFAIFSPYESALRADDGSLPYFPICQGTLPWQPNNVEIWEINESGLIPPAFFALARENELEYHYLWLSVNSSDDQATSDINLVGFWPVPPEFNCVEQASVSDRVSISTFARC